MSKTQKIDPHYLDIDSIKMWHPKFDPNSTEHVPELEQGALVPKPSN